MNVLTDELISATLSDGSRRRLALPELLTELAADRVTVLPRLRPHQAPAWHVFLVQLATMAARSAGALPQDADGWLRALRLLTPAFDADEPWQMVGDDWLRPALFQPPCTKPGERAEFRRTFATPDQLDVLMTSKNHDQKSARMVDAAEEEWLFALLTLQTTEGFLGAGNYGIARMNGGFASRAVMRFFPAGAGLGRQIFRDIDHLLADDALEAWSRQLEIGTRSPRHRLLWLLPWDGNSALPLTDIDPLAVEICRRVRLVRDHDGRITALGATSKAARLLAKDRKGVVADPWLPVVQDGSKAFTVTGEGFGYRRVVDLLDRKKFHRPHLAEPTASDMADGMVSLSLAALARGQGKTEGFHSRTITLSPAASLLLFGNEDAFGARARHFVDLAAAVSGKALRPALIELLQGTTEPDWARNGNGTLVAPWLRRFDGSVDTAFFVSLAETIQLNDDDASAAWSKALRSWAQQCFEQAADAAPRRDQRALLVRASAGALLRNALRKQLPALSDLHVENNDG